VSATQVGRLLGLLRRAAAVSREDASLGIGCRPSRMRDIETGRGESLGYFEGRDLAKCYSLCPTCFYRLMDGANERDRLREVTSGRPSTPPVNGPDAEARPAPVGSSRRATEG
jgi:hypothetical protein